MSNRTDKVPLTVTVPMTFDATDLWSAVMGSGWTTFEWWTECLYLDGEWDVPGRVRVGIEDPENEELSITTVIDINDLTAAISDFIAKKYVDACVGRYPNWADLNIDACVGDSLMQIAVLGDVVYG